MSIELGDLRVRRLLRNMTISLIIVLGVVTIYSLITSTGLPTISMYSLISSILLYLVGWLISAIRLQLIVKTYDPMTKCSLNTCLSARFIGDLLAKITPSSIGGEPARAHVIHVNSSISFLESYAITLFEVYHDVVLTCIIGIVSSILYLPLSIPVLLVSVLTLFLWIIVFNIILPGNRSVAIKGLEESRNFPFILLHKVAKMVIEFKNHYTLVFSRINLKRKIVIWLLTIITHFTWASSLIPLLLSESSGQEYAVILEKSIAGFFLMQAISILPTPGGSIAAEYGLSLALKPSIVVAYRLIHYTIPVLIGLLLVVKAMKKTTAPRNNPLQGN